MVRETLADAVRNLMARNVSCEAHRKAIHATSDAHALRAYVRRYGRTRKIRSMTPGQVEALVADADTVDEFVRRIEVGLLYPNRD